MNSRQLISFASAAVTAVGIVCSASLAAAQGKLELKTTVEKEITVLNNNGERIKQLVAAGKVVPGEEVVYTIFFKNIGTSPAENVVITDPIPANTAYKADTAFGPGTDITFSVDGGEHFDVPGKLIVTDASGEKRVAGAREYTHVRWDFKPSVKPGARGFVRFRAVLN